MTTNEWPHKPQPSDRDKRFYVLDRGATQAKELHRFSAINPRYAVIDRETHTPVDDLTTKKAATEVAADLNRAA